MRLPTEVLVPGGPAASGDGTTLAATVVPKWAGSGQNPGDPDVSRPDPTVVASFVRGDEPRGTERRGQRRPQ